MKYFSSFAGIGGFEIGIENSYKRRISRGYGLLGDRDKSNAFSPRGEQQSGKRVDCVGYSEIDKYAIQIYKKHFKEHNNYGDITKINTGTLPDFDLFVGGFPCQSFSIAGKRRGFEDTRGTLFFEIARILKDKRPRYFVLENVKGLLSHDEGNTFKVIIAILDELGYFVEWQVLNSKNFGVPQNRERVFIIGHLGGECRPKVFPVGENDKISNGQNGTDGRRTQAELSTALICIDMNKRISDKNTGTIDANYYKGPDGNYGTRPMIADCKATQLFNLGMQGRRQKDVGDPSFTLDSLGSQGVTIESKIRRLTPIECERLQGFPDNWTDCVSDTQRYKTLGNAVTVNVIEFIMRKLFNKKLL